MKSKLLAFSLALAIAQASMPALHAASKKDASPSPSPAETPIKVTHQISRPLPFSGKIFTIDKDKKTFSTENKEKKLRTYATTPETKFSKNNADTTFEALKVGDEVRGMAIPKGDGNFETVSLTIGAREEPKALPAATPVPTPIPKARPIVKKAKPTVTPTPSPSKRND